MRSARQRANAGGPVAGRSVAATVKETSTPRRPADRPGRYGLLLLVLVGSYLLSSFVSAGWVTAVQVALFGVAIVLAVRSSALARPASRLVLVIVLIGTGIMIGLSLGSEAELSAGYVWIAVVLLGAVVMIVYRVLSFGSVTLDSIFGAVSAYLVLGMMFAAVFGAIDHLGGGHFFAGSQPANTKTLQYFSFTTLTTLGYGDFTAAASGGRSIAILEALTGQVFLATLVARLVAAFRGPAGRQADGGRDDSGPGG
jgi:Ion channel